MKTFVSNALLCLCHCGIPPDTAVHSLQVANGGRGLGDELGRIPHRGWEELCSGHSTVVHSRGLLRNEGTVRAG